MRRISFTNSTSLDNRRWYGSLGVSTLLHVGMLAALGTLWSVSKPTQQVAGVNTRWSQTDSPTELSDVELTQPITKPAEANSTIAAEHFTLQAQSSRRQKVPRPFTALTSVADARDNSLAGVDLDEEVGALSLAGSGEDDGNGGGFFGISAPGKRFVYVVDSSRSMNHPHPSEAKTRFGRVKLEMLKSVYGMDPEMEFYIVFFNDRAIPMPASRMQPALAETQKTYLKWMSLMTPNGKTEPLDALILALRLKPDVIYFLTDGNFHYNVVKEVTRHNRNQVAIHTFCFGDRNGEPFLKEIAENNRGRYQFIP